LDAITLTGTHAYIYTLAIVGSTAEDSYGIKIYAMGNVDGDSDSGKWAVLRLGSTPVVSYNIAVSAGVLYVKVTSSKNGTATAIRKTIV